MPPAKSTLWRGYIPMQKLFLFLLVIFAIYYFRRIAGRTPSNGEPGRAAPQTKPFESMQECMQCGLIVPTSEGVVESGNFYCCAEHARVHRGSSR